jgi:hypothetical protein
MFIPDPDFIHIPEPTTETKEEGEKVLSYLFCSHKYKKIVNYFISEKVKKKIEIITKNYSIFTLVTKLSTIWVWYPGSGKTYSGFRFRNTVS